MRDVVNACGPAADLRVGQFHKFQAGDGAQELPRSVTDFLSVEEMTGVLVGDAQRDGFQRLHGGGETEGSKKFGDVTDFRAEGHGLLVLRFVQRKEMVVFLERGAAACRVRDEGVEIAGSEGGEIFAGELLGNVAHSGVRRESATAELAVGDDNFTAVGREDSDGGLIELREGDLRDAAGEQGDACAARANGGKSAAKLSEEERIVNARKQAFAVREAEKFQYASGAGERLQAEALVKANDAREGGDTMGMRKQVAEHKLARKASEERALVVALNERAGVFDELAILDCGRACSFAGTAVQAFINVIDEGIGDRGRAFRGSRAWAMRAISRVALGLASEIA